jgi:hypothetical protein
MDGLDRKTRKEYKRPLRELVDRRTTVVALTVSTIFENTVIRMISDEPSN